MKLIFSALTAAFCSLLIAGCGVSGLKPTPPVAPLPLLPLVAPAPNEVLLKQSITLTKGVSFHFISVLRHSADEVQGAVLTTSGQTLVQYHYDGKALTSQPENPERLPLHEMFAVMQLSLWPSESLSFYHQQNEGWGLQQTQQVRELSWYGKPLFKVEQHQDEYRIYKLPDGYTLKIQPIKDQS